MKVGIMKYSTLVRLFAVVVGVSACAASQDASAQSLKMIRPELNGPQTKIVRPELNAPELNAPQTKIIRPELNGPTEPYMIRPELNPGTRLIDPNPGFRDLPKLGFYGYVTRDGMVVTDVRRNTPAWRVGLEKGDVIVAVDGYWITREGDYERALSHSRGNHVDLKVADVRGRGTFLVHVDLDDYHRPVVEYRSRPVSSCR